MQLDLVSEMVFDGMHKQARLIYWCTYEQMPLFAWQPCNWNSLHTCDSDWNGNSFTCFPTVVVSALPPNVY
jgi:hypothetical protein